MNHEIIVSYIKAILPLSVVFIGAWFAFKRYLKEKKDEKELIVNAVFGDLTNVIQHYVYAERELHLLLKSESEKMIRLRFSQFGKMMSIENLNQLGNLSAMEIREILQLNLRIRNTDLILEDLQKNDKISDFDIQRLKMRMELCKNTANSLIESITMNRKELKQDFAIIKRRLNI